MRKLTDQQVKQKLTEGRNYKRLYVELKDRFDQVTIEHKECPGLIAALTAKYDAIIETQAAQISELQTMVFGRKQRPRSGGGYQAPKQPRDASSYRRPKPAEEEITSEEHRPITACNHCGGPLTNKETYTHYIEDIVLAALHAATQFKTVEKQTIERGYCVSCGKYSSATDLRGQETTLGPNVRTLICYLITLRDHSYDQAINLLWDLYRFKITDGEITTTLDARRLQLLPEYEKLKDSIRAGPAVHMDESRWRIQSEKAGYAWSMSSTTSSDVVFNLADNRGMGNAEALLGEAFTGIGITDRYRGYKHLFALHQICWAHLQRTAKDLTHLECLSKAKQKHVTKFYQSLSSIYAAIRAYQDEPFDGTKRKEQVDKLLSRTKQLCRPHDLDPKKLADLKAGILEYQDCLFVWLAQGERTIVKVNRNKESQSYIGFLNQKSFVCEVFEMPWQNQQEVLKALEQFLEKHPDKLICLVWDNAPFHKGKDIRAALAKGRLLERVHLVAMPPYAPDHNPIEHVWNTAKQSVANIQHETFSETKQAFSSFVSGQRFQYSF